MGIKDLWPLLNPYCVRKPLYDLQGKTVAIDLAGWICESLCVVDYEVHARFYLRYEKSAINPISCSMSPERSSEFSFFIFAFSHFVGIYSFEHVIYFCRE